MSKRLRILGLRTGIVILVYLAIKLTIPHDAYDAEGNPVPFWDLTSLFYFLSAFFLFMLTWELSDYLIDRETRRNGLMLKGSARVFLITFAVLIPITAAVYYAGIYIWPELTCVPSGESGLRFRIDFLRALLIGFAVVIFNLFYHTVNQKKEVEDRMAELTRSMTESKYQSLKSQISPHFLFNSLNTLTSLMYQDRDLASDFVSRLASTYRYILDHREEDLVEVRKELQFLDSFVFMMAVRHKKALSIHIDVPEKMKARRIPTLSLQMLLENALKHNMYSPEKPLTIEIGVIGEEALFVRNNLQKRKGESPEPSTGIGLANIRERYAFYTHQSVLVREEKSHFEVILPLLHPQSLKTDLYAIS